MQNLEKVTRVETLEEIHMSNSIRCIESVGNTLGNKIAEDRAGNAIPIPATPTVATVIESDTKLRKRVMLPREVYLSACRLLCDAIDGDDYFNGEVCFRVRNIDCRLLTSVIIYRRREEYPEGVQYPICDLVPVWWEFRTERDGDELMNDFSFEELRRWL